MKSSMADFSNDVAFLGIDEVFPDRELKSGSEPSFNFQSETVIQDVDGKPQRVDTSMMDKRVSFEQNLKYWNAHSEMLSVNNYENSYFDKIVAMGADAVPFIIEELDKGPTALVHALDLIFPDTVEYNGCVSLNDACKTWLSILR